MHCFYDHDHYSVAYSDVTKHRSRHTENSLLVQHFDNQQSRSNLIFFVITNNLTLSLIIIKTIDIGSSLVFFFSKGLGLRHRFSGHVMAGISDNFYFYLLCNRCQTQVKQIKTKTV